MDAQLEQVSENRVRLTVAVPSAHVEHAVEHAASDLAQSVKIPGFRAGKVPMPVLIQRVGKERIYSEAIDSHIEGWFWSAAARARIRPVSMPSYDFELPDGSNGDWTFSAEVDVQAAPTLPDWKTLMVGWAEPELPEGLVETELEALRSSVAELIPVEDRPVGETDTAIIDVVSGDEAQRDIVVELGVGRLVPELEAAVVGMSPGETKDVTFPRDDEGESTVQVTVKEIKEKVLPPLDDELAKAASEFETIEELRASIEERLLARLSVEYEQAFRENAVDQLVAHSEVVAEGPLVESRARELLNGLGRSLERRGMTLEVFLQMTGQDPNELVERMRENAQQSVARELVLEALAEEAGIEVSDDEVKEYIREQAGEDEDAEALIESAWQHGAQESLREDIRLRAALDRLVEDVQRIPIEQAEAREKIWTPEKEKAAPAAKLWTPGGEEKP